MKKITLSLALSIIVIWIFYTGFLLNYIQIPSFFESLANLTRPTNTTELGDSIAAVDSLFSALALIAAILAVIMQGKELKESTQAQKESADANKEMAEQLKKQVEEQQRTHNEQITQLTTQLNQQAESIKVSALCARLEFLVHERDRLKKDNEEIYKKIGLLLKPNRSQKEERDYQNLKNIQANTSEKREKYKKEIKTLSSNLEKLTHIQTVNEQPQML